MKAIPTIYNGLQFRSRLEATWAAFFDLMGWKWEYEPCDFPGWIPDFLLGERTYVEVKPWRTAEQIVFEKAWMGCGCKSGDAAMIVCGVAPLLTEKRQTGVGLGWGYGLYTDENGGGEMTGEPVFVGPHGLRYGWHPKHDALDDTLIYPAATHYKMLHAWREAKNRVQWRAPK